VTCSDFGEVFVLHPYNRAFSTCDTHRRSGGHLCQVDGCAFSTLGNSVAAGGAAPAIRHERNGMYVCSKHVAMGDTEDADGQKTRPCTLCGASRTLFHPVRNIHPFVVG
jgi:hypothetical protein